MCCIHPAKWCGKAHIHTHRGVQRDNDRRGTPKVLFQATSRPITVAISPSNTHLHKPRRTQGHNGRQESKLEIPQEQPPCLDSSQGCPIRVPNPVPKHKNHYCRSSRAALQITFGLWGSLPRSVTFYKMQKKAVLGNSYYVRFRGETRGRRKGFR